MSGDSHLYTSLNPGGVAPSNAYRSDDLYASPNTTPLGLWLQDSLIYESISNIL